MANVTQKSSDLPKNMANVTQKSMWSLKNLGSTEHTWSVSFTRASDFPHFTRHYISKILYATSDLSSTSLKLLRTYLLQNCLHPTLWIRKMTTYKVVHSEYFCATMIVLQQFIISGRHGFIATILHSPRSFRPCLNYTGNNTDQLRAHAFTPQQVGRPGRKHGGFERHLFTRPDPRMLFVLANSNVCVISPKNCILPQLLHPPATAPSRWKG
jgi:hypothetical protein